MRAAAWRPSSSPASISAAASATASEDMFQRSGRSRVRRASPASRRRAATAASASSATPSGSCPAPSARQRADQRGAASASSQLRGAGGVAVALTEAARLQRFAERQRAFQPGRQQRHDDDAGVAQAAQAIAARALRVEDVAAGRDRLRDHRSAPRRPRRPDPPTRPGSSRSSSPCRTEVLKVVAASNSVPMASAESTP